MNTSVRSVPSRLSLRANFSWTFAGNVVYAACQWGLLVVLAKLGSPEMVGQYALGLAMTAPIMMFASLRMRLVQATDATRAYAFGDYLGLRLITTTLALLVILGITLVAGYDWETTWLILAVGVDKAFNSISDVFYGVVQWHDRMDRMAKSMMIKGPLSLVALSVGVYLTGSVFWGVIGLVGSHALVLALYDIRSGALMLKSEPQLGSTVHDEGNRKGVLRPRWDRQTLASLAWLMLPLGLVALLSSLKSNIPRYFIERHWGASALGIFAALAYFERAGTLFVQALAQSATPRLARRYAAGDGPAFRTLLLKLAGAGALVGMGGVLVALVAGREILTLVYQPEYAQQRLFVQLMIAAGLNYVAYSLVYGVSAAQYFQVQVLLYGAVTVTLVLACVFLIPSGGLDGAATALILANGVQAGGGIAIAVYILLARRSGTRGTRVRIAQYDAD